MRIIITVKPAKNCSNQKLYLLPSAGLSTKSDLLMELDLATGQWLCSFFASLFAAGKTRWCVVDVPLACSEHMLSLDLDHICFSIVGVRFELKLQCLIKVAVVYLPVNSWINSNITTIISCRWDWNFKYEASNPNMPLKRPRAFAYCLILHQWKIALIGETFGLWWPKLSNKLRLSALTVIFKWKIRRWGKPLSVQDATFYSMGKIAKKILPSVARFMPTTWMMTRVTEAEKRCGHCCSSKVASINIEMVNRAWGAFDFQTQSA